MTSYEIIYIPTHATVCLCLLSLECPDGFVRLATGCYLIGTEKVAGKNEAVSYCNARNAKLVNIETEAEQQAIANYLNVVDGCKYNRISIMAFLKMPADYKITLLIPLTAGYIIQ